MTPEERETALIGRVIEGFQAVTPIRLELAPPDKGHTTAPAAELDGTLYLRLPNGQTAGPFALEIKRTLNKATLGQLYQLTRTATMPTIVVTDYVNRNMAEALREANVLFIDTAGNALINAGNVFVHIVGQKRAKPDGASKPPTQALRAAGLKLILALLDDDALLNRPYRQIAEATGVALGTITNVFNDLEELRYLQTIGDRRRLLNRDDLLHQWAAAYIEKARDKQLIGRFNTEDWRAWTDADLDHLGAYWGGEVAAQKMTGYLKPETATLYLTQPAGRLQAEFQLRRDPNGPIELLRAFWPPVMHLNAQCAPPIVVYADLLTIGDDRALETARLLYEKYIAIDRR